ncbi:MAG TPA: hypothetical protein VJJ81_00140 [Candidatus Babeliales bacterium]|nr:hypothetical protein [Candidatus Babeliales bacterium]
MKKLTFLPLILLIGINIGSMQAIDVGAAWAETERDIRSLYANEGLLLDGDTIWDLINNTNRIAALKATPGVNSADVDRLVHKMHLVANLGHAHMDLEAHIGFGHQAAADSYRNRIIDLENEFSNL